MAAVNRRVVNSLNEGRRAALTSYRHRRSIATAICTLALAANVGLSPLASAAEGPSLITPAEKISDAEVRQSVAEQLVARIQRSTETDASITIDEDALVKLLEAHGNVRLPVASQSTVALRPQMAQESAVDVAAMAVNDAVITYNRPLASKAIPARPIHLKRVGQAQRNGRSLRVASLDVVLNALHRDSPHPLHDRRRCRGHLRHFRGDALPVHLGGNDQSPLHGRTPCDPSGRP